MFEGTPECPPDPILALIDRFANDPRGKKLDLGLGVYKNKAGITPVMDCVKAAEKLLVEHQLTKTYLGSGGNREFASLVADVVLGKEVVEEFGRRLISFQTVGGTGALRLAAELLSKSSPGTKILVGLPTWPNHLSVFHAGGLTVETYPYFNKKTQELELSELLRTVDRLSKGDVFLLHGCCHNPTGADVVHDDMSALIESMNERGVIPLIDLAYAGLSDGFIKDLHLARRMFVHFDEAIICFSCSKSFSLYRERVGNIIIKCSNPSLSEKIVLALSSMARANYSMPPDHGAAVVAEILKSKELKALWLSELDQIRGDIVRKRRRLSGYQQNNPVLRNLATQHGMFSLLPIEKPVVTALREDFGIYMTENARINVLGVPDELEAYFVDSISRAYVSA
jgi:aromatic-amino-acid transaminase